MRLHLWVIKKAGSLQAEAGVFVVSSGTASNSRLASEQSEGENLVVSKARP